jgi:RHS repeat-associated protein
MPGRQFNGNSYRYGFQNQEEDPEIWGGSVSFKYRMEDPRLGRFFSVDPLTKKFPHNSPYAFSENSVIAFRELEGLEKFYSADGRYIATIDGENSSALRISSFSHSEAMNVINTNANYDKALMESSIPAYTPSQEMDINHEWAKEYKPKSGNSEHAMIIYANTFTNENYDKVTLLIKGTTVHGDAARNGSGSVAPGKSELGIGAQPSSFGWSKYSMIHTHWATASKDFTLWGDGLSTGDIELSLAYNIPVSLAHPNAGSLKTFDPKVYKQNYFKKYHSANVDNSIDKGLVKQTEVYNTPPATPAPPAETK